MAIRYLMKIKKAIDKLSSESDGMMVNLDDERAVRMWALAEFIAQELKKEVFGWINTLGREPVSIPSANREQAQEMVDNFFDDIGKHQTPYIPGIDEPDMPKPPPPAGSCKSGMRMT